MCDRLSAVFHDISGHRLTPWLLAAGVAALFGAGLLRCGSCIGIGDWDYFTARALVSRRAVLEFGQLPSWDPYHCGGMPIAANFQSRTFTPSFLLVLALGPIWGVRLWAIGMLALGFEGGRRLAGALGGGGWAAMFVALAIACNGHVLLHLAAGHLSLLTYLLTPWLMLGLLQAQRAWRPGVCTTAAWAALGLLEGGLQPMLFAFTLCGLLAAASALQQRKIAPLVHVCGSGLLALGLAAIMLVPLLSHFALQQRGLGPEPPTPWQALAASLFGLHQLPDGMRHFAGQNWLWHEYGTYVGPLFPVLVAIGSYRAGARAYVLLGVGALLLLAAFGDHGPLSPGGWLARLPVFSATRVPMRLLATAVLCCALAASVGLDWRQALAAPLVLAFAANLALVTAPISFAALGPPLDLQQRLGSPYRQFESPSQLQRATAFAPGDSTLDVLHNRSNLMCYEPLSGERAVRMLSPAHGELELLLPSGPAPGRARIVAFSPAQVQIELSALQQPSLLVFNQNFDTGWERTDGEPVQPLHGRIATMVATGTARVTLVYRPLGFYIGAIVSLTVAAAMLRLRRRGTSS